MLKIGSEISGFAKPASGVGLENHIPKLDFKELMQAKLGQVGDLLGDQMQSKIKVVESQILSGKKLSMQELLVYQVHAGQFGLRVELISKLAETVSASWRRLQNG